LLYLVGCLYYCIRDARSHKHQIYFMFITVEILPPCRVLQRHGLGLNASAVRCENVQVVPSLQLPAHVISPSIYQWYLCQLCLSCWPGYLSAVSRSACRCVRLPVIPNLKVAHQFIVFSSLIVWWIFHVSIGPPVGVLSDFSTYFQTRVLRIRTSYWSHKLPRTRHVRILVERLPKFPHPSVVFIINNTMPAEHIYIQFLIRLFS